MLNAEEILWCVSEPIDGNGRDGNRLLRLVGFGTFAQRLEIGTNAVKAFEDGSQRCVLSWLLGGFRSWVDGRHDLLDAVEHRLHFRLLFVALLGFFLCLEVILERGLVLFPIFCHDGIEFFHCEWFLVIELLLEVQKFKHGHELFFEIHKLKILDYNMLYMARFVFSASAYSAPITTASATASANVRVPSHNPVVTASAVR